MSQHDGWSSKVRIEADGQAPITFTVRHFMTTHLILDGEWHTLRHNEEVKIAFNYVIDGKITFLHLNGRVRLNRMHGITLEFDHSSILRQMSRRLLKGKRYEYPCHFLATTHSEPVCHLASLSASEA